MSQLTKVASLKVPQSYEEALEALRDMGLIEAEKSLIEEECVAEIKKIEEAAAQRVTALQEEHKILFDALAAYAAANRSKLTSDKKKSVEGWSGSFGWKNGRTKVVFEDSEEKLAEVIESMGLADQFVKIVKQIPKDPLLKQREVAVTIPGIKIEAGKEEFFAKPAKVHLEKPDSLVGTESGK